MTVSIRHAEARDAAAIAEIYAPYVRETAISFEEVPPDDDEVARRIDDASEWIVAEEVGTIQGYAYAGVFNPRSAYRWSCEVSVYLDSGSRGRGLGRLLLADLLDRLRAAGFVNAFAGIALPNDASIGLFESAGFHRVALYESVGMKLARWHDVGWWQLRLREPTIPPDPLP